MADGEKIRDYNKYGEYRRIRFERTWRPLGKMSWWRVVLGLALLIFAFLLSGALPNSLASRGRFKAAERAVLSERWLEKYRPELKAFIEAGVLYEDGDYEGALRAFDALEDTEAVRRMRSAAALGLCEARLTAGDREAALEALLAVEGEALTQEDAARCGRLCEELLPQAEGADRERLKALQEALTG